MGTLWLKSEVSDIWLLGPSGPCVEPLGVYPVPFNLQSKSRTVALRQDHDALQTLD